MCVPTGARAIPRALSSINSLVQLLRGARTSHYRIAVFVNHKQEGGECLVGKWSGGRRSVSSCCAPQVYFYIFSGTAAADAHCSSLAPGLVD